LPRLPSPHSVSPGVIWVVSDLRAVEQALEGRAALRDLVWDDRIRLFGTLDDLLEMHDTLRLYLQAAVRSPSAPRLLRAFRQRVAAGADVETGAADAHLPSQG
jgi:hypothetical protein